MPIVNALASLAVRDVAATAGFYEELFGPARRPMTTLLEWQFERGGGLQVYEGPERAGQGACTVIVDDIEETASLLRGHELAADPVIVDHGHVVTIMIKDPDGNSIAFAQPEDPTLVQ